MKNKLSALAWVLVYFCRIVLIVNGIIYARSGIKYFGETYDGFELRENGNSSMYSFQVLEPVIKDEVIKNQFTGLLILAPFMGAAYICVAFTSLAAAFFFRNPEASITLLLQASLLSMLGCIVRPHEPDDVYNEGAKDNVQSAQLVAVITGWIGAFGPIVAALIKQQVPTPIDYVTTFYSSYFASSKDDKGVAEDATGTAVDA